MIPKPICAVCEREVEHLELNYDVLADRNIYVARCHGAREIVEIEIELLCGVTDIEVGRAFVTPTLKERALSLAAATTQEAVGPLIGRPR